MIFEGILAFTNKHVLDVSDSNVLYYPNLRAAFYIMQYNLYITNRWENG